MPNNQLICKNDFIHRSFIEDADPTTGLPTPATTGTVTGFIAVTSDSEAVAAHANLSAAMTHTGVDNEGVAANGWWKFAIDAAVLTKANLDSWLGGTAPRVVFFIVDRPNSVRRYEPIDYTDSVEAEVLPSA